VWSLVIEKFLTDLNSQEYQVFGFADDVLIILRGKVDSILSEQMQTGLNYASNWCKEANLRINSSKMVLIPFTRRR
jgi:Reverse transcriptase (RNA-dependent DNA polymerase)